ncbi:hypothetical protein [Clostridium sp. UBA1056]|uniref:hypothetical protein n=1 Tax=unclassified Clostridium TaxID=2614128 RepID=UPI003216E3F8
MDLIEHIESQTRFKLIQSNTDDVMFKLNSEDDISVYESICKEFEERSHMSLEHDIINKVVQKDVNKREKYFEESLEELESLINKLGTEYVKQRLGTRENSEKDVIRLMMLKRM